MRTFSISLLSLAMGAALAATPAAQASAATVKPSNTPGSESAAAKPAQELLQFTQMRQMQLTDDRCHWLDASSRAALDASTAERKAWLQDKQPKALTAPNLLANAKLKAQAAVCNSKNNPEALAIRYGSWQMRITWALRAHALLDGKQRPAWFTKQSPVLPYRKALEEMQTALDAKYASSLKAAVPKIELEAAQMLAAACPNAPRKCPLAAPATPSDMSQRYAQVWVQQTAQFAKVLSNTAVKLPPPPEK